MNFFAEVMSSILGGSGFAAYFKQFSAVSGLLAQSYAYNVVQAELNVFQR